MLAHTPAPPQSVVTTVLKVVRRSDISSEGHATMPEFMGSDPAND
jgi:hypothetical protein